MNEDKNTTTTQAQGQDSGFDYQYEDAVRRDKKRMKFYAAVLCPLAAVGGSLVGQILAYCIFYVVKFF